MSEDMLEDVFCPSCGAHSRVRREQLGMKCECKCGHSFTLRASANSGRKEALSDEDILATLSEGPPVPPHLSLLESSWQAPVGQNPEPHPSSSAHPKQRSAVGQAVVERTSEAGRQIPRYRMLKAMGSVFRILGVVSAVVGVVGIVVGLSYTCDHHVSSTGFAKASGLMFEAFAALVFAIVAMGIGEAICAFRDLVINSWIAIEE